jgi:hypothetical protein
VDTGLLAIFYLGWLVQVLVFQKRFDYALVPPLFLALTLLGSRVAQLSWRHMALAAAGLVVLIPLHQVAMNWYRLTPPRHWGAYPDVLQESRRTLGELSGDQVSRLSLWPRCWKEGASPQVKDDLRLLRTGYSADWTALHEVAMYLRGLNLRDGELTCYNNSTHPLYLELGLQPSTPYLHFDTIIAYFPGHRDLIRRRLGESGQRYVVSDLRAVMDRIPLEAGDAPVLPVNFPATWRRVFPWNEPIVFHSGPYLVHRYEGPMAPLLPSKEQ